MSGTTGELPDIFVAGPRRPVGRRHCQGGRGGGFSPADGPEALPTGETSVGVRLMALSEALTSGEAVAGNS